MITPLRNGKDLRTLCQEGRLNEALQILDFILQQHNQAPINIFACLLRGCITTKSLTKGREVHARLIKNELEFNVLLGNSLVELYAKYGDLADALQVFNKMPKHNVFSWTAIISANAKHGPSEEAVKQFHLMIQSGVMPDNVAYVTALKSCPYMEEGRKIHAHIMRSDTEINVFLESTLIDMYGRWGSVDDAHAIFIKMCRRVEVSWNAMIGACTQQQQSKKALALFEQMQTEGTKPDNVTFVNVIGACTTLASIKRGKQIHTVILRSGIQTDNFVECALIEMYARCGGLDSARQVFNNMCRRDVVSWNAMITGYAQQGFGKDAVVLFDQMHSKGIRCNKVTFLSVLKACTMLVAIELAKQVHAHIIEGGLETDAHVENTLVDMYAKCGSMEDSRLVFENIQKRDLVSWNAVIRGYALQGIGNQVFTLFGQMQQQGMKPNEVTFVSILSACSHGGLIDGACQVFGSMSQDYDIIPTMEHYSCMVDLLGRVGCPKEAHDFIKKMPIEPNIVVWMNLLCACRNHGNIVLGRCAFESCVRLDPKFTAAYVQLYNIYAAAGRWDEVANLWETVDNIDMNWSLNVSELR